MKKILALFLIMTSLTSLACADLSGKYQAQTGETLIIEQSDCVALALIYPDRTESFILDNQKREIFRDQSVIASASAAFVPSSPIIRMTWENFFLKDNVTQKHFRRLALFSNSKEAVLLDQRGKFRMDGYFVPDHQITFARK